MASEHGSTLSFAIVCSPDVAMVTHRARKRYTRRKFRFESRCSRSGNLATPFRGEITIDGANSVYVLKVLKNALRREA